MKNMFKRCNTTRTFRWNSAIVSTMKWSASSAKLALILNDAGNLIRLPAAI